MKGRHSYSGVCLLACLLCAACDGGSTADAGADGLDGGAGTDAGMDATMTSPDASHDAGAPDAAEGGEDACVPAPVGLLRARPPVDLIVSASNSGSMSEELAGLRAALQPSLFDPLGTATDLQVIVVSDHGAGIFGLCIESEVAGGSVDCSGPPGEVEGRFHHYDVLQQSLDGACVLLDSYRGPAAGGTADQHGLHPNGWSRWLRPDAHKVLLLVQADRINCTWSGGTLNDMNDTSASALGSTAAQTAASVDQALLGFSAAQFGTPAERRYVVHALVGVSARTEGGAHAADDPLVATKCFSAANTGPGYQWLAKGSGGLRYPSCSTTEYGDFFGEIVTDTLERAPRSCRFALAEPSAASSDALTLRDGGAEIPRVADAEACEGEGFHLDGEHLVLCPASCAGAEDEDALELEVGCPE